MVGLLPTGDQPVPDFFAITRGLTLIGSFRFNDEIDDVIAALADGSLDVSQVVTANHRWRCARGVRSGCRCISLGQGVAQVLGTGFSTGS